MIRSTAALSHKLVATATGAAAFHLPPPRLCPIRAVMPGCFSLLAFCLRFAVGRHRCGWYHTRTDIRWVRAPGRNPKRGANRDVVPQRAVVHRAGTDLPAYLGPKVPVYCTIVEAGKAVSVTNEAALDHRPLLSTGAFWKLPSPASGTKMGKGSSTNSRCSSTVPGPRRVTSPGARVFSRTQAPQSHEATLGPTPASSLALATPPPPRPAVVLDYTIVVALCFAANAREERCSGGRRRHRQLSYGRRERHEARNRKRAPMLSRVVRPTPKKHCANKTDGGVGVG
ncbi:hypothetical protein PHYSODRAFT_334388 [Phytophthora sojae]|uniref:Uncharacterized protein n=1 Tax=Phytophthora sojae (strain P6497) TaxID=1094619 RepID=G4ZKM3_PHYSP|nr:hypothetical protein PHYSODRAFT_334388 [Phytophthora sojae]EGZ16204.1 hypothetical protein PHYSODRAFT_334388 [Phytophthora sojae]|eukprot:XP_009529953.1 hypothetical protein PHYSODRAFT_334388 [Phytophthora sojae]